MRCFLFLVYFFMLTSFAFSNEKSEISGCADGQVISKIEFLELKNTRTRVIERELTHKKGLTFSKELWLKEKGRLESLDLFTEVRLSCKNDPEGLILEYHLPEIFRIIPSPAGKKTDQDGLMLGLALAHLNLGGDDIRAEIQYRTSVSPFFSSNEYAFYASSPWFLNRPIGWNFEFLRTSSWDNLRLFEEESYLADMDLQWFFKKPYGVLFSLAYRYLTDYGYTPSASLGFLIDTRHPNLDTRFGVYQELLWTYNGGILNSDQDYQEFLWDSRFYYTMNRFVSGASSLLRYRPGDVAFYDRLHHGGANTFRGFDPDSLCYGTHEWILNFEERFVLKERTPVSIGSVSFFYGLQWVLGVDGAFLWDEGFPTWSDYHSAIYTGLHIVIPALERIRFEVGYSPDKSEPKFFIGLYEKNIAQRWRSR